MDDADRVIRDVGRRIGELRSQAGLTQAQMAERLEMTVSNYQRIEQLGQNCTIRTLHALATVLEATVAELFAPPISQRPGRGRPRKDG